MSGKIFWPLTTNANSSTWQKKTTISVKTNYNTIVSEKMCAKSVNKNFIYEYIISKYNRINDNTNKKPKVAIALFEYLIWYIVLLV